MHTRLMEYQDNSTLLEAYVAFDEKSPKPRPAVLVVHDWTGRNEFACKKAEKLAELGYVGVAIDMYGKGVLGRTKDEKIQLMTPLMEDRSKLQQRILAGYKTLENISQADTRQIAVIGFCFGGLCALDLARSGVDLKGVVSFHGLLKPPSSTTHRPITAKVLALHGYEDPMVDSDEVATFQQEMTKASVDWQMHIYSNTLHAFTNPLANDKAFGTVYNATSDNRSWIAMKNFLTEIFA